MNGDVARALRTLRAPESLRAFAELGTALIGARDTGEALDAVISGDSRRSSVVELVGERLVTK